jgi:hypothetical protein
MSRPGRYSSRFALIISLLLTVGIGIACTKKPPLSAFEKLQVDAYQKNPSGLRVELRTAGGKTTYRLYESIPIEIAFSSSKPVTYSVELNEGMNGAGSTNYFLVEPADSVFAAEVGARGVVCCDSVRPYLWNEPTILHRDLTSYLRFEKPGTFQLFYRTRRVFRGKGDGSVGHRYLDPSDLTVASNIVTISVLPDDPTWDAAQLESVKKRLDNPAIREAYNRAFEAARAGPEAEFGVAYLEDLARMDYARAQAELTVLDTDDGVRERVLRMKSMPRHTFIDEQQITATTRPAAMFDAMLIRAKEPDFPVDENYLATWATVLEKRDHPKAFRVSNSDHTQVNPLSGSSAAKQVVTLLREFVKEKRGEAKRVTQQTIADWEALLARTQHGSN